MMLPDDPNWQMTVFLLLALVVMAFVMKLVALLLPAKREIERRAMSWSLTGRVPPGPEKRSCCLENEIFIGHRLAEGGECV